MQLIKVDLWPGCNQGCKVINITNIEATGVARCSCKGVCSCPIILIIGKEVVHSEKAAAGKVCHLLWMLPIIVPSQNALTHTLSEIWGAIQGMVHNVLLITICTVIKAHHASTMRSGLKVSKKLPKVGESDILGCYINKTKHIFKKLLCKPLCK